MKENSKLNGLKRGSVIAWATFLILAVSATPAKCNINAWPFLEINDETTTVLYPFYVNEEDFKMVFPLYYNTNNGNDHHLVWPFFKISEGRLTRIAPFWFSEKEESYTLFPFIRRTPEYTLWTVPPVYLDHDSDFFAIFPVYMTNRTNKFIFPSIYMKKNIRTDELERFVFFPLYSYKNNDSSRKMNLALLSGYEKNKSHTHSWLFPVYDKMNKSDTQRLWVFPYYSRDTSETHIKSFFPFYYYKSDQTSPGKTERTMWCLWPVYDKKETLSDTGRLLERKRRFLVFSDELTPDGIRTMKILGIPVRETFSAGLKIKDNPPVKTQKYNKTDFWSNP